MNIFIMWLKVLPCGVMAHLTSCATLGRLLSVSLHLGAGRNTCLTGGSGKEAQEYRYLVSTQELSLISLLIFVVKYFLN